MPGYAAALAALDDRRLERLLAARGDLTLEPWPSSFGELASRASGVRSLAAALDTLDATALQLAELLALLGLPTTMQRLAVAAGPRLSSEALEEALERLADLGIALPQPDGTVVGPRNIDAAFGRPGGLGPSVADLAKVGVTSEQLQRVAANLGVPPGQRKAELTAAVAAALSDPQVVARALESAGPPARTLFERARPTGVLVAYGLGYGARAWSAEARIASLLVDRGLLLPRAYDQLVVPREVEIARRGGWVFPSWPVRPAAARPEPAPDLPGHAAAAARRLVMAAEGLLTRLDRMPLPLIKTGAVGIRDIRRLAGELGLGEDETGFALDLAVTAGLAAVGGAYDQRGVALTVLADGWLAASRADRWAALVVAYRDTDLPVEDHLIGRHGHAFEPPRPLLLARSDAAAERRRELLQLVGRLEAGTVVEVASLAEELAFRRPGLLHPGLDEALLVTEAASLLGLTVMTEGRVGAGPALGAWLEGASRGVLAGAVKAQMPDPTSRLLVAGDATVVAPDGLAPPVEAELSLVATRSGSGQSWRVEEASLFRALDEGRGVEQILGFLRQHSDTGVPQALEYLVADAARRHGRLRVGAATTYLRGDPALITQIVRSTAGRKAGLRELAPGVATSSRPQREVLVAARRSGEAPVVEEHDGTVRLRMPKQVRYQPAPSLRELEATLRPGRPQLGQPAAVVARMRGAVASPPLPGSLSPVAGAPAPAPVADLAGIAALCRDAALRGGALEIAYDGEHGPSIRTIEPFLVSDRRVRGFCHLREAERTFNLERITWARPAEVPGG